MPDAETSTSTLHGTCYQCSLYHLDQASSPLPWKSSWVLRRDGEKTPGSRFVKPPCVIHSLTSFTCDSFSFWAAGTHIGTRVWFSRCITSSGAGASRHALYMIHYGIRCVTQSNLRWVALMMNRHCRLNSLSGMYLLNRSVLNLILSLELHPMSISCREPGIDSFLPLQEPHDVLYHLLSHCYRLKENILSGRDCWVFYQLWGE